MAASCTNSIDAEPASPTNTPPHDPRHLAAEGRRQCGWCTETFAIVRRPGRPRIYCSASCKQRAYERRRGLGVLPPPDRIFVQRGGPLAHMRPRPGQYESGRAHVFGKLHAMRSAGIADAHGRRLTLCGLLAEPAARGFNHLFTDACRTCERVAEIRPPQRPLQLSADLAALRALVDAAGIELSRSPDRQRRDAAAILTTLLRAA